jgi:hypothetical protein
MSEIVNVLFNSTEPRTGLKSLLKSAHKDYMVVDHGLPSMITGRTSFFFNSTSFFSAFAFFSALQTYLGKLQNDMLRSLIWRSKIVRDQIVNVNIFINCSLLISVIHASDPDWMTSFESFNFPSIISSIFSSTVPLVMNL